MRPAASLLVLGFALAVACYGALAQAPVAPPPASPEPPAVALSPAPVGPGGASYDRRGRRDPFEPVDALDTAMTSPTVAAARLKGIVRGQTPRVLVETADGLGYILKVGDMLGEGRLVEIGPDSAVFSVPARRGSATGRVVLRLPED